MSERDITVEEARGILSEYGGYGKVRVYHTYKQVYAGQIGSIKSTIQLDDLVEKDHIDRLYAVGNDGSVPIRRA